MLPRTSAPGSASSFMAVAKCNTSYSVDQVQVVHSCPPAWISHQGGQEGSRMGCRGGGMQRRLGQGGGWIEAG